MLICEGCLNGTHLWCLDPPLPGIPGGDWYCFHCQPPAAGMRDGRTERASGQGPAPPPEDSPGHGPAPMQLFTSSIEDWDDEPPSPTSRGDSDWDDQSGEDESGQDDEDDPEEEEDEEAEGGLDAAADVGMLSYLTTGTYPGGCSANEKRRIRKRAAGYLLQDDQLYKKPQGQRAARRVPAAEERRTLIRRAHDSLGHYGAERTTHLLQQRFWWRGMCNDVREFIRSCPTCQADDPRFPRHDTLHSIPPEVPMTRLGVDLLGPFPRSRSGMTYVATAVEYGTRFGMAAALPDRSSGQTSRWLASILGIFGCPRIVMSDRGGEFQGEFEELCQSALIDHRLASAYSPTTSGLVERFNMTVGRALRRHAQEDPETWDEHLPWILCGYNGSIQSSSRFSPYRLMFGREPNLPLDNILPPPADADPPTADEGGQEDDGMEAREALQQQQLEQARANIERAQANQQQDYQRRRAHTPRTLRLEAGEMVMER
ncbi:hypothetical protein ABPG75_002020 [Micractinium tetrahymenae]